MDRHAVALILTLAMLIIGCEAGGEPGPSPDEIRNDSSPSPPQIEETPSGPSTTVTAIVAPTLVAQDARMGSTGDPLLDSIIKTVEAGDTEEFIRSLSFQQMPCGPGREIAPTCPAPGMEPGTPIEAFPVNACHRGFFTVEQSAAIAGHVIAPHLPGYVAIGLYEPDGSRTARASSITLLFAPEPPTKFGILMIYIRDGRITELTTACGSLGEGPFDVARWIIEPAWE